MTWNTPGAPVRDNIGADEIKATPGQIIGNTAESFWLENPVRSLYDLSVLENQERGKPIYGAGGIWTGEYEAAPTATIDKASAVARAKDAGVSVEVPETGIPEGALDILIQRKKDEATRDALAARSPGGALLVAGQIGTAIAVSAIDPLNIASAFIPVVGEARYAAMLAKGGTVVGRAGVRAGVGAVEGAVGAAVIEPLVYSSQRAMQADYDMTDSLLNVAVGAAVGGGIHVLTRAGGFTPPKDGAPAPSVTPPLPTTPDSNGGLGSSKAAISPQAARSPQAVSVPTPYGTVTKVPDVTRLVDQLPPQAKANLLTEMISAFTEGREPRIPQMIEAQLGREQMVSANIPDDLFITPRAAEDFSATNNLDQIAGKDQPQWVIKDKETGRLITQARDIEGLNIKKYEAIPMKDIVGEPVEVVTVASRADGTKVELSSEDYSQRKAEFPDEEYSVTKTKVSPNTYGRDLAIRDSSPGTDMRPRVAVDEIQSAIEAAVNNAPPLPKNSAESLKALDEKYAEVEADYRRLMADQLDEESDLVMKRLKEEDSLLDEQLKVIDPAANCLLRAGA